VKRVRVKEEGEVGGLEGRVKEVVGVKKRVGIRKEE
jgi:hypothetical protein